jgi:hypothetical protein
VLVGRRTAEQAGHYKGDHHGVPIFVLSHRPPPPSVADYPLVINTPQATHIRCRVRR